MFLKIIFKVVIYNLDNIYKTTRQIFKILVFLKIPRNSNNFTMWLYFKSRPESLEYLLRVCQNALKFGKLWNLNCIIRNCVQSCTFSLVFHQLEFFLKWKCRSILGLLFWIQRCGKRTNVKINIFPNSSTFLTKKINAQLGVDLKNNWRCKVEKMTNDWV